MVKGNSKGKKLNRSYHGLGENERNAETGKIKALAQEDKEIK
jgi:hypothetical protein